MPLFLKIAILELRGGFRGFYIALACLAVSSFTLTASNSFTQSLTSQLQKEGRTILGGDVELSRVHLPFSKVEIKFFEKNSDDFSLISQMRVMAQAKKQNTPAELKAIDAAYPLIGALGLYPKPKNKDIFKKQNGVYGVVASANLLTSLGIKLGEVFKVGAAKFQLRAIIENEPDGLASGISFAPRILISNQALKATKLVKLGSLITYRARLLLSPEKSTLDDFILTTKKLLPNAGWQMRTKKDSSPSLRRFIERIAMFLTLSALATFLVSGIGIANAVSVWFAQKRSVIATLKCLGASQKIIIYSYLTQILIMAILGTLIGIGLGVAAPFVFLPLIAQFLPLAVEANFYWQPIGLAILYGVLISLLFSLMPLAIAKTIPPTHLFRAQIMKVNWSFLRNLGVKWWAAMFLLLGLLFFIALAISTERSFVVYFIVAAAASLFLFYGVGTALVWLLLKLPKPKKPIWRIAISNITRPGSQSLNIIMALGLGMALLSSIALIDGNLRHQIDEGLPLRAPSFFVADIQEDKIAELKVFLQKQKGIRDIKIVPLMRASLVKINGKPVSEYKDKVADDIAWVLRGDRGVTYASQKPEGVVIAKGRWWDKNYQGAPLLSISENVAEGLGLEIGDSLTVNLLGVKVKTTIHNFRKIYWAEGGMNFVLIFSPSPFNQISANYFATFRAEDTYIENINQKLLEKFPTMVVIETSEALKIISSLLEQIAIAARFSSAWTLLAGILVLAAAMATSFQQKLSESIIFKVLGARRSMIAKAGIAEYLLLGLAAAIAALIIAALASYAVITFLWQAEFLFLLDVFLLTIISSMLISLGCGLAINHRLLAQKPAPYLRALVE